MGSEILIFSLFCAVLFGIRFLPPDWKYLSPRKRRAVRLALREFSASHEFVQPDRSKCRIYQSDEEHCIVLIPEYTPRLRPPVLCFYSISNGTDQVSQLGSGQCHWGNRPEDLWESGKTAE